MDGEILKGQEKKTKAEWKPHWTEHRDQQEKKSSNGEDKKEREWKRTK